MATLSATVSEDLKTALVSKSLDGYVAIDDNRIFYSGSTLYAATGSNSGWIMCISNAAPPRHFRTDATDLVRAWQYFELETLLLMISTFQQQDIAFTYSGPGDINRKCIVTIDSVDYEGEQLIGSLSNDQADIEAFGKAVIAYLDSL